MTFGYNEGVDIRIKTDDDFEEVIKALPKGWVPDFCILWWAEWNLLPRGIENAPFPTISCVGDWDYDIPYAKAIVESTDVAIAGSEFDKKALYAIGANRVESYYFMGVMKEFFDGNRKNIRERKYDIFYTSGTTDVEHPDRSKWIIELCSLCDKYNILISSPITSYKEYMSLLGNSKLVLTHVRRGLMSGRVLEAGAQGTVSLDTGVGIKRHFVQHQEFIPVTEDSLYEMTRQYLENESLLQDMSEKIYAKVNETFESRKRFVELMRFVDGLEKNKKPVRKSKDLSEEQKCVRRGEVYYYTFFRGVPSGHYITNQDTRKFLQLSIEEFKNAVAIKATERSMLNLAVAKASFGFLFEKFKMTKEKGKEVISILEKIVAVNPSYAMAYFNLGLVHLRVNNLKEALASFMKALEVFRDKNGHIDLFCLHNRDSDLFNLILRKPLNENLLLLYMNRESNAFENIRDLYQAAMQYYICLIEEENGKIYNSLDAILESHNLYPDSGVIARKAAKLSAIVGLEETSLVIYRKAINLLPLDIDLRIEYMHLLYLYQKDEEVINELKESVKITKTVSGLREKTRALKEITESFGRLNANSCYSHDVCEEKVANGLIEPLYVCLRKDPKNIKVVLRIIGIWNGLGRIDKIVEIIEDFIDSNIEEGSLDYRIFPSIRDVYYRVLSLLEEKTVDCCQRLGKLKEVIGI